MEEIAAKFRSIEDPRHSGYTKHALENILILTMCAVLCGLDTLEAVHVFGENNQEFLREHFGMETLPSKATLGRVLSIIDGAAVGKVMIEILRERIGTSGKVIAVDGKAICSTSEKRQPHSALQILTAYMTENGVTLAQEAIHEKTNEIPVFQQMLDYLNIKDKIITADAIHCQRETCAKIVKKEGEYVLGLKKKPARFV